VDAAGSGVPAAGSPVRRGRSRAFAATCAFVGVALALTASLQWIMPLVRERSGADGYAYVPIRESSRGGGNDKSFYYAHVREIIDGTFPSRDPVCLEHKAEHTPHVTYSFSLLMCALGGMATGRTEHAYSFNLLVYPLLSLALAYLILRRLIGRRPLSLLLAFCALVYQEPHRVVLDPLFQLGKLVLHAAGALASPAPGLFPYPDRSGANLLRTPNVLFVNVVVLGTFLQAHRVLAGGRRSAPNLLALAGLLLASVFTSAPAFVVCVGVVAAMSLAALGGRGRAHRTAVAVLGFALVVGAAGFLAVSRLGAVSVENAKMADISYPLLWALSPSRFLLDLAVLVPGALLVWGARHRSRRTVVAAVAACCALYLAMSLLKGSWAASHELYRRGFLPLFTLLVCASVVRLAARASRGVRAPRALAPALVSALLLVLPALEVWMQYRHTGLKLSWWDDREFKQLATWSRTHFSGEDVAVTLDADLILNLPIYSPVNVYLPPAVLSAADRAERIRRLAETAVFFGIGRARFERLLSDLVPAYDVLAGRYRDPERDAAPISLGLLDLVLFYNQHHPGTLYPFDDAERRELLAAFDAAAAAGGLRFQHTVLIVAPFDRSLIAAGSPAAAVIEGARPLYASPRYAVYRIAGGQQTEGRR
jgi:hypothetical protein